MAAVSRVVRAFEVVDLASESFSERLVVVVVVDVVAGSELVTLGRLLVVLAVALLNAGMSKSVLPPLSGKVE